MSNKGLENLKIYQLASRLEKEVYIIVNDFPKDEKFRQADQLMRSTSSICDNIAESYGKYSFQSKIHSMYISRGEAEESRSQIERAVKLNLIEKEKGENLAEEYTELIKMINGYIRFLRLSKSKKDLST